jgi:predicted RNase H-like nuclease (RuvC/YqgF family)
LTAALQKISDLENSLLQAEQAQEKQRQEQAQQQENSDASSRASTAEIVSLRQQLSETRSLVDELRASLASAAPDLTADLGIAQARAKSAEQALTLWRIATAVVVVLAVGLGVWAAVK